MRAINNSVRAGDDSGLISWIAPSTLGICARPLRYMPPPGGKEQLEEAARPLVESWIDRMSGSEGIRSVISLSEPGQLARYDAVTPSGGLLGCLRASGISTVHLPLPDPGGGAGRVTMPRPVRQMTMLLSAQIAALTFFDRLPAPVLVFCSGAIDRSPPVAAYIAVARMLGDPL
jgi:hypothetical protein